MEERKRDLNPWAKRKHYQEIFTGWKLGKRAKDRHMTLYRQYTDMAKMVQVADMARQAFWTLLRSLKAIT